MNTSVKRALAVCVLAAVAFAGFGCGKKGADSEMSVETISLEQTKQDLTFDFGTKKTTQPFEDATEAQEDATEGTEGTEETAETVDGTQIEEVTQVVNVTDEEGHGVTDAAGQSVTDYTVVETRVVQNPQPATAAKTEAQTAAYTPEYDTCKAYWLDMSQQGDYTFNGEFLTLTFEVNKDIPDGSYPVTIATTDIASWDLVRYTPVIVNGEIAVNSTAAAQEDMSSNDFCLKVNSQSAKQGETVTMTIDLGNNPGFCGFVIDIQYDANALTIIEAEGGKDFDAAVHLN